MGLQPLRYAFLPGHPMLTKLTRNRQTILAVFLLILPLTPALHASQPLATIPFIGCPSDGQMGPRSAAPPSTKTLRPSPEFANKLAYYQGSEAGGVLAPRGWHSLLAIGSDGDFLVVTPAAYTYDQLLQLRSRGIVGPASSSHFHWAVPQAASKSRISPRTYFLAIDNS
jgi:hypothetical protein